MATSFGVQTLGNVGWDQITGSTATAGYSPAQTWVAWNNYYLVTGTTTVQVWGNWNQAYYQQTFMQGNATTFQQSIDLDPQVQIAAEEAQKKREAAQRRAEEFLLENLNPAQRESYRERKIFIVETPRKNRYVLSERSSVRKLDGEREVVSYCIHTLGVPREDELLGFKLLLEANEDEFLKTANATRLAA